jgi:hypothetical protein
MAGHLLFLRTYKLLGLSLNAPRILLINGDKPPMDRGICKHLLSKVDRRLVEKVLARDAQGGYSHARVFWRHRAAQSRRELSHLVPHGARGGHRQARGRGRVRPDGRPDRLRAPFERSDGRRAGAHRPNVSRVTSGSRLCSAFSAATLSRRRSTDRSRGFPTTYARHLVLCARRTAW